MKKILPIAFACLLLASCSFGQPDDQNNNNSTVIEDNESFIPSDFDNDYGFKDEITYSSIFENNYNATCRVKANYGGQDSSRTDQSSGFIYKHNGDDYYVLTSASRIAYKSIIKGQVDYNFNGVFEFKFNDGRKYRGEYKGCYRDFDIGVFKIHTTDYLPVAVLGSSDELKIGQPVGAIGTPDADQPLFNTYVEGVVSGLNRKAKAYYQDKIISIFSSFQFDAPINNGMQGGPVINGEGKVVGIITNKQVDDNIYESLSFGIAMDDVINIADQIIEKGEYEKILLGFSGGSIDFLNKVSWASDMGIYSGIYVVDIVKDGRADKAGLKGDSVITAVKTSDGKVININSMEEFQSQLVRLSFGDSITLCVRYKNSTVAEEIKINL